MNKNIKINKNEELTFEDKINIYVEREDLYLDLKYSDDILNIYMNIQEYIKGCNILENLSLDDLTCFIKNYSSLYDIYYDSDDDEEDDLIEYNDYY